MDDKRLNELLGAIDNAKIALIGDFCLDVYWRADMRLSELSRETPHYPLPIVSETYSPGGAGNVAANIAALAPGCFMPVSVIGSDWRGMTLKRILEEMSISTDGITVAEGYITNTYIKPLRSGISDVVYEDPRIDFENREPVSDDLASHVALKLERAIDQADVICVSDQMKYGCITDNIRDMLTDAAGSGKTVIVDSRDNISKYTGCIVKPNEIEASRAYADGRVLTMDELGSLAMEISRRNKAPSIITLGAEGCLVACDGELRHITAKIVTGLIDFVGAGDTFLAAVGTLMASGADIFEACETANCASAVTIKKLNTTGTASRAEIRARFGKP